MGKSLTLTASHLVTITLTRTVWLHVSDLLANQRKGSSEYLVVRKTILSTVETRQAVENDIRSAERIACSECTAACACRY